MISEIIAKAAFSIFGMMVTGMMIPPPENHFAALWLMLVSANCGWFVTASAIRALKERP